MTERFKATVQYSDWEGTAAADSADEKTIHDFLKERKLMTDKQFVIGVEVSIGENHVGRVQPPIINVIFVETDSFDDAQLLLGKDGTVNVMKIVLDDVSLEQFLGLFKRFSIAISRKGLNFIDREYNAVLSED